jgi:hypothetical protein
MIACNSDVRFVAFRPVNTVTPDENSILVSSMPPTFSTWRLTES